MIFVPAFAAEYTAIQSGNWSDLSTWGETSAIPGMDGAGDVVKIASGVDLVLDTELDYSISKIQWESGGGEKRNLTITAGGKLTTTDESQLWYKTNLDINVINGGEFNMANLAWDADGDINVKDGGKFYGKFTQMKGTEAGKTLLVENATAGATGEWKLEPTDANTSVTIHVKGATGLLDMNYSGEQSLYMYAANNAAAIVKVTDGGKISGNGTFGINYWDELRQDATNRALIHGAGSQIAMNSVFIGNRSDQARTGTGKNILELGGLDDEGNFAAAGPESIVADWNFYIYKDAELRINFGNENAGEANGPLIKFGRVDSQITVSGPGLLTLDFTNVDLSEGEYVFNLISSTRNAFALENLYSDLNVLLNSNQSFDKDSDLVFDGNNLSVILHVSQIPEPASAALLLGLAGLALAASKRRRN